MQVSRNALQSYPQLAGQSNTYYFGDRTERNAYFSNTASISVGQLCAVGGDPTSDNWEIPNWEAELYNGTNWEVVGLDSNFALIVTNEGIKALANASAGQYKFELSRIAIKQTTVSAGTDVATWDSASFLYPYTDICLDTYNIGNTTFTIQNNISCRTNLLNGGLQFTLTLGLDCIGQKLATPTTASTPTETDFKVAVIGLFVKNQTTGVDVLFAVANLPGPVEKVATTPTRIGNMLKFYLNTTLSNLSTVINTTSIIESVSNVPEVQTDDDITDTYDGIHSPYNLYLVDNYSGTNVPAIAVRKGSDLSSDSPITWTYFTPTDDTLTVSNSSIDSDPTSAGKLDNYMIAAWDTAVEKYVAADGNNTTRTQQLTGLYTNNTIIYAGTVANRAVPYSYAVTLDSTNAFGYSPGETLYYRASNVSQQEVLFAIHILTIDVNSGQPTNPYYITPATGSVLLNLTGNYSLYTNTECSMADTRGLTLTTVASVENTNLVWNFPASWLEKPLYADYDHTNDSNWVSYCTSIGLNPNTEPKNRRGKFTIAETQMFVGWCLSSNSVRLALDLRNEATYTSYGTTRYATQVEVNDVAHAGSAAETTAVTPKELKNNYFQLNAPSGNTGNTSSNPIEVNSYTKFNHTIIGSGMTAPATWNDNISFYGMSYRAMWADLAEYYRSDRVYPGGTLICFGSGLNEITLAKTECNGIVSTKPGYQLGEKTDELDLPVALCGKVPVLFAKDCMPQFGDRIYLSKTVPGRASTIPNGKCLGKIIDKNENLDQCLSILCVVRIEF